MPSHVTPSEPNWSPAPPRWGRVDALVLVVWSLVLAAFFADVVGFRGALFYFDVTELNYPYRAFLADELRAGRFSRWIPGLYCGHPLYSESQAGYLHPLKYLLYPWMATWKAFNLDTVLSVWLAGLGTYGWLRRHVGPAGAITGATVFALGGFTWAHLIHTSMINALPSVPLVFWALEVAWDRGRLWPLLPGGLALACQVFAGHLQDAILTGQAVGVYGLHRVAVESGRERRAFVLGTTLGLGVLGVALAAVQWLPSKELIDRSPRAGGLSWEDMTYGSWHPELLPTFLIREAYGTRARDTDWMDGFYPYHEMNVYLGVVGLLLAAVGAGACRDRWVGGWLVLGTVGLLLMLGKFTFLMDGMHRVPLVGSGRVPVRYHLWLTLAAAALAAVGVDRLARPGPVALRGALVFIGLLIAASVPLLLVAYQPAWSGTSRWTLPNHLDRNRWLTREALIGLGRTTLLTVAAIMVALTAARSALPRRRAAGALILPALAMADLLGAHWSDVPTVDPRFWTEPPASATWLKSQPAVGRIFGENTVASGEPGYASHPIDFFRARETIAWSLAPVWGLRSTAGETPIIPTRRLRFTDAGNDLDPSRPGGARPRVADDPTPEAVQGYRRARFDIEGLSHILSSTPSRDRLGPYVKAGGAYIHTNDQALPRARFLGRPIYADGERAAARALLQQGGDARDILVVEDPDRPLPTGATASGTVRIVHEVPERVELTVEAQTPGYVFLADSYDPGWTATVDGRAAPVRPAQVAFRAVSVPAGTHTVVFSYEPVGFRTGLILSLAALLCGVGLCGSRQVWPSSARGDLHGASDWPARWPWWLLLVAVVIVVASTLSLSRTSGLMVQSRWARGLHRFTWGAGIEAMQPARDPFAS